MVTYRTHKDIGIVEFNDLDSKVNLLSNTNLNIVGGILDNVIANHKHIKALFFVSKKKDIFVAGADIKELIAISSKEEALQLCKKGQDLFNKIESLEIPTFAVVDGVCIGGGLELALACDYIIATKNKRVKFGLPEVKLGIVPGFGGPHRLKAKIGTERADELISTGRFLDAMEAKRLNIVDKIIPQSRQCMYEKLLKVSRRYRNIKNQPELDRKEREVLAEKILKEPARNALSSYLLISKYKGLERNTDNKIPIRHCTVVGAGRMGKGIAYLINAETDTSINLCDVNEAVLARARFYIKDIYKDAAKRGILGKDEQRLKFKNLSFSKSSPRNTNLIIESIPEEIPIKKKFFAEIEKEIGKDSIIATNTSCIPITELSKSLRNAERFLGVHFFNPPYKIKLVEVIPTRFTKKVVLEGVIKFLRNLKRIPVVIKDSPGFLVNRMLLPYLNEAVFMVYEGIPPENIESSMLEFGMPVGPLQLIEEIGPEVVYKAGKILEDSFGNRMKVPDIRQNSSIIFKKSTRGFKQKNIINRLLHPIKREALLCLKEGLVDNHETIDLALLLGIGFPRTKRIWKI
jgi:3-hydroxyacyl-CoA dehydrogenase/enoyl-CoA hydratase/3-hydroxybutyryl-CoA epimerase